ncbi:hypothetical protein Taro_007610 [Colocasia esculenta]|uniref:EF-hand domain-containing protein n=1 Tax=Colocasia esculenta TaxID=4460 RepID=A0A843TRR2_COLES|nr:hypothetical protein [Colocasia esculenta]
MAAARQEKLKMVFRRFDVNGDGRLDRDEMAALIQAINPRPTLTREQTDAAVDEVFRSYANFLGVGDEPRITLDVLLRSCGDGTAELDRDFKTLGLSLDVHGDAPYSQAAADATAPGISPASLSPRPPDLLRPTQEEGLRGDESEGKMDGDVASPRPPASWGPQYSISSSLASSSFCSVTEYSDLGDYEDPYSTMEIEEKTSFRWLPPSFRHQPQQTCRPVSSEVDWQQLIPHDSGSESYHDLDPVEKSRDNNWVVFGEDESTGKRCCIVQARGLIIRWRENQAGCWSYKFNGDVAELSKACWLEIGAEVGTASLSPGTNYICVLLFLVSPSAFGLGLRGETQEASVYVGGRRVSRRTVRLQRPAERPNDHNAAGEPRKRKDGWMEMVLGEFSLLNARGWAEAPAVRVELREVKRLAEPKGGLFVRGVELTPESFAYKNLRRV